MVSLGTQPANRKSGFGHSSPTGARAQDLSRQPARPDLWGARVSNDPGLPDRGMGEMRGAAEEGQRGSTVRSNMDQFRGVIGGVSCPGVTRSVNSEASAVLGGKE